MSEEKKQVNVDFTKFPELLADLDQMVDEDDSDRSKFIRKLVKQEKARRESLKPVSPVPTSNPKKRNTAAISALVVT